MSVQPKVFYPSEHFPRSPHAAPTPKPPATSKKQKPQTSKNPKQTKTQTNKNPNKQTKKTFTAFFLGNGIQGLGLSLSPAEEQMP